MGDFELLLISAIELAKEQVGKQLPCFLFFFRKSYADFAFLRQTLQLSCMAPNNY
jgi:hypothetical protein